MRLLAISIAILLSASAELASAGRPNVLIMISDDQSFPHASAYGSKMVSTPNFDRIAREGVLFNNAFCASPGCSPSRAAFLTGRHTWQIEHAGTHASSFDQKYRTFMDLLAEAGYATGYTGKGWGPGNFRAGGRDSNPAGPSYGAKKGDYAAAFARFLADREEGKPFCFWFGSSDPHRGYQKGSGLESGKTLEQAEVPSFLPDTPEIRSDLLDYAFEVERFDRDCGKMLELLEAAGELDDTLIIVTSDNGMPFPYAKANCTEFGIHMPLAISWKKAIPGARSVDDLVSFVDLTATIHEATGIQAPAEFPVTGRSFLDALRLRRSGKLDRVRNAVYAGRERHSSSRYRSLGYPQRCVRTGEHLLIWNARPERWPAGPARKLSGKPGSKLGAENGGFHDIDACPTLSFMIQHREEEAVARYFNLAVAKRPEFELFDMRSDPGCLTNIASEPSQAVTLAALKRQLAGYLTRTRDPRAAELSGDSAERGGDIFETYRRYSGIRWFPQPDWAKENPEKVPSQPWIEELESAN